MNENLVNNDWINDAPVLASMKKRNPFVVPDAYFESSSADIHSSVFLEQLKEKTKREHFDIPENYFEELTERILIQISLLEKRNAQQAFGLPEHYFDTLQSRIQAKIAAETPKSEAKVVKLWSSRMIKFASAACFLIIASFGVFFYQNNSSTVPNVAERVDLGNEQILYDIDEGMIIEHLEAQQTTTNTNKISASDTEMENYILSNFSSNDLSQALNN
ncbi:hypothetical protein ACJVDH_03535 [Pedobacter sp. AW1-32]|uniref:hypothetical protein n=1 Tax=Pedobacter sp. AW1-32 TaxID=3383026 RepID=UPI003FEE24C5